MVIEEFNCLLPFFIFALLVFIFLGALGDPWWGFAVQYTFTNAIKTELVTFA